MSETTPTYFKKFEEKLDAKFEHIDQRFNALEHRFDVLESKFDGLEQKVDRIEDKLDVHTLEIKDLQKRTSVLESAYA